MNLHGTNSKLIKIQNQSLVLNVIQQNDRISRKDIAALTGLTQATITNITNKLLNYGLVVEAGKDKNPNRTGRKAILLSINKERYNIISIYIGRHILQGAISDLSGTLIYTKELHAGIIYGSVKNFSDELVNFIHSLIDESHANEEDILGIGLSAPGPINAQNGVFLQMTNHKKGHTSPAPFDWSNIPVKEIIQKEFNFKVFADNEANVLALAERWFGNGIGIDNFVLYSIGVGIGSGVIIDGMLYRGEDDVVSEIGHITIDYRGKECICGNIGCLEHYASLRTLVTKYYERTGGEYEKELHDPNFNVIPHLEKIFRLALNGESLATELIRETGEFLGIGAVSLANIYSPELIILSGNDAGDIGLEVFLEQTQNAIKKRAFSVIADKVMVTTSKLGRFNHLYGGVALVLQDYFPNIEEVHV